MQAEEKELMVLPNNWHIALIYAQKRFAIRSNLHCIKSMLFQLYLIPQLFLRSSFIAFVTHMLADDRRPNNFSYLQKIKQKPMIYNIVV